MSGTLIALCLVGCLATEAVAQQDGSGSVGGTYLVYKSKESDAQKSVWLKLEPSGPATCEVVASEKPVSTVEGAAGTAEGIVEPGKQIVVKASGAKGSCAWKVLSESRLPADEGHIGGSHASKISVYKNGTDRSVDLTVKIEPRAGAKCVVYANDAIVPTMKNGEAKGTVDPGKDLHIKQSGSAPCAWTILSKQ
jgi:hypothetical protein